VLPTITKFQSSSRPKKLSSRLSCFFFPFLFLCFFFVFFFSGGRGRGERGQIQRARPRFDPRLSKIIAASHRANDSPIHSKGIFVSSYANFFVSIPPPPPPRIRSVLRTAIRTRLETMTSTQFLNGCFWKRTEGEARRHPRYRVLPGDRFARQNAEAFFQKGCWLARRLSSFSSVRSRIVSFLASWPLLTDKHSAKRDISHEKRNAGNSAE